MEPKLVSMERTKAEKKDDATPCAPSDAPDYPYGLCLSLDAAGLAKLGVEGLPDIGEEMTIYAVCKVTRVSASASENDKGYQNIDLQITDMALLPDDETGDDDEKSEFSAIAGKIYPKKD